MLTKAKLNAGCVPFIQTVECSVSKLSCYMQVASKCSARPCQPAGSFKACTRLVAGSRALAAASRALAAASRALAAASRVLAATSRALVAASKGCAA